MAVDKPDKLRLANSDDPLAEVEARPPWRPIAFLGGLLLLLLGIVYLSPLRHYLSHLQDLRDTIRNFGWLAPVVLTAAVAVLAGLGFPRLVLCALAGMALGFWWGLLAAQLGTLTGNYALFVIVRASGGDWVRRYVAKRRRVADLIHEEGVTGVILARQLPVPGMVVNLALGLLSITHRDFLLGTFVGQLPQAIPCTLIGAGVLKSSFAGSVSLIGLAIALAVLVWVGVRWFVRRREK